MKSERCLVVLFVVAFALTITVSLASADYVVIKDKNEKCSVRQSDHKTPKTVAGPFKTKEEAVNWKEKECATASTPKEKEPGLLEKAKEKAAEKAKEKDKAKQELKEKEEKAKQQLKEKQERIKQEMKEKQEKAKQAAEEKSKQKAKEKEEKAKEKAK